MLPAPRGRRPRSGLASAATRWRMAVQNIDAMQVQLGRWIAANTPPGSRVALNDVGAIAYVSRREVVDVMGLVTPAIIAYRQNGEPGVLRYLERTCPDYLVIFPVWFPMLSALPDRFRPITDHARPQFRRGADECSSTRSPDIVRLLFPWRE